MSTREADCPLCLHEGGVLLWQGKHLRVIEVEEADYPGFTRVIWHAHIAEMSNLSAHGRDLLMRAVYAVEQAQQETLHPDKINLASLGNVVPHLHWHVIPRWRDDRHFPDPIWAAPRRAPDSETPEGKARHERLLLLLPRYRNRIQELMTALLWH